MLQYNKYEEVKDLMKSLDELVEEMRNDESISMFTDLHLYIIEGNIAIIDYYENLCDFDYYFIEERVDAYLERLGLYGEPYSIGRLDIAKRF